MGPYSLWRVGPYRIETAVDGDLTTPEDGRAAARLLTPGRYVVRDRQGRIALRFTVANHLEIVDEWPEPEPPPPAVAALVRAGAAAYRRNRRAA